MTQRDAKGLALLANGVDRLGGGSCLCCKPHVCGQWSMRVFIIGKYYLPFCCLCDCCQVSLLASGEREREREREEFSDNQQVTEGL